MPRKYRPRPDRLTAPEAHETPGLIACGSVLMPLDEVARQMEAKWGIDRLPGLVSTETAARFGSALEKLERAIDANDPGEVQARADILIRGWKALDREATERGAETLPRESWAFRIGDQPAAIVQNEASAAVVQEMHPGAAVYTLEEIGRLVELAINELAPRVAEAKGIWPGAEVADVRMKPAPVQDQEIPF